MMTTYPLTGLDGKVAVVTGAGRMRSIGRPCAVELARAGCDIVLTGSGRAPEHYPEDEQRVGWRDIESVADEIRALGRRCATFVSDVRDRSAIDRLVADTVEAFGGVDIVINNAGASRGEDRCPVIELEPDVWDNVIGTNLTGTFLMSRAFGQVLKAQGRGGSIVNMSSIAGKLMPENTAAYAASKAGIQALTAAMSREMARYGVRVNAICPGIIDTARMDDVDAIERGEAWQQMVRAMIPLGRAGQGLDIAWTTVFLCSDQGAWITGQSWNVDGGTVTQH
jgi:3-oxoacyl-[acyl-carrier protein] reductase/meso-butanediol dehydrogenase/(S,S)-butanediol dehydrogenase/diacetyl reductase